MYFLACIIVCVSLEQGEDGVDGGEAAAEGTDDAARGGGAEGQRRFAEGHGQQQSGVFCSRSFVAVVAVGGRGVAVVVAVLFCGWLLLLSLLT